LKTGKHTYGQILKSSTLIGGSSVLNLGFRVVRTKVMALLLGPTGIGLLGIYEAISDLTRTAAGMGIKMSGVRQIAAAVGSEDTLHIARTVTTLRRVALCSGTLGALLLLIFSKFVSRLTFGDDHHAGAVALLALVVLFTDISEAQGALVQGMRRIADLARMSVWGAFYGTLFSIPIVYFYYKRGVPERGVVPSLVCVAAMGILTSWWYARKVKVEQVSLTPRQVASEASALLKLGVVFMATGIMTFGMAYLIRIIVLRKIGIDAAGYYQSAFAFGSLYVGFIIQAMGADFYPRLTAVAHNDNECNRLVNEQVEVGLLMAGPGVLATLTFAPLVIQLFYSARFGPAVEVFRWICLGMILRVASWPMGFVLIAKGERKLFFWSELVSNLVNVCLVWVGVIEFGLKGTGIAFFALYVVYWIGVYLIVRRLTGFRWSAANQRVSLLFLPLVAVVFVSWYFPCHPVAMALGAIVTVLTGIYSLKTLCALVPLERFPKPAQKMILFFRLASPNAAPDVKE
jgi:PST family polysaccharide transporter